MASSSSTAMTPVEFAGRRDDAGDSGGGGQLVLDEEYADDSYDYGDYGEGEGGGGGLYGDDSGLMDPSTGLPMPAGADGNKGRTSYLADIFGQIFRTKICNISFFSSLGGGM